MNISAPSSLMPSVSLNVDLLPLLLFLALLGCGVSVAVAIKRRPAAVHGQYMALGGSAAALGLLLIVLRGSLAPIVSILFGNWLLLLGEALIACGSSRYIGRSAAPDAGIGLFSMGLFTVAYCLDADVLVRVAIYTLACAFFSIRAASSFFQARPSWINRGAGIVASLLCLVELIRAAIVYGNLLEVSDKAAVNGMSVMIGVFLSLLVAVAVLALHWETLALLVKGKPLQPVPKIDEVIESPEVSTWVLMSNRSELIAPNGHAIRLTGNEYMVLQKLSEAGEPVQRLALNAVIGRSTVDPKDRGIDILFSRLRRKCADEGVELPINALRSRGYVFLGELRRE